MSVSHKPHVDVSRIGCPLPSREGPYCGCSPVVIGPPISRGRGLASPPCLGNGWEGGNVEARQTGWNCIVHYACGRDGLEYTVYVLA